jgi:hypothetical protein
MHDKETVRIMATIVRWTLSMAGLEQDKDGGTARVDIENSCKHDNPTIKSATVCSTLTNLVKHGADLFGKTGVKLESDRFRVVDVEQGLSWLRTQADGGDEKTVQWFLDIQTQLEGGEYKEATFSEPFLPQSARDKIATDVAKAATQASTQAVAKATVARLGSGMTRDFGFN